MLIPENVGNIFRYKTRIGIRQGDGFRAKNRPIIIARIRPLIIIYLIRLIRYKSFENISGLSTGYEKRTCKPSSERYLWQYRPEKGFGAATVVETRIMRIIVVPRIKDNDRILRVSYRNTYIHIACACVLYINAHTSRLGSITRCKYIYISPLTYVIIIF